jgi:gliding motility-associated protein GldE
LDSIPFIQLLFTLPFVSLQVPELALSVGLLLLFLVLSFFIAGYEVALFSLRKADLDWLKTKPTASSKRILQLLDEPKAVYVSLLMGGTFLNICSILLANLLLTDQLITWIPQATLLLLVKVLIISIGLIFGARILPKVWASQNNLRFAIDAAWLIGGLHQLLRQPSLRLVDLADRIGRVAGSERTDKQKLDEALDEETNENTTTDEKNILRGVIRFGDITVRQIMKSRLDVSGIEFNTTFEELTQQIESLHYSRLPVYRGSLDEIVGILHTKELLPYLRSGKKDWHTLLRAPFFVPEQKPIEDLFREFQQRRVHFAVVVDEFGGTSGIVTLEDVLEEVIGEIQDEFDEEDAGRQQIDAFQFVFDGKISLTEACRYMQQPIDTFDGVKGESDTVAGLVLELAGGFPSVDESFVCGDFRFTVLQIDQNRIQQVRIHIQPEQRS